MLKKYCEGFQLLYLVSLVTTGGGTGVNGLILDQPSRSAVSSRVIFYSSSSSASSSSSSSSSLYATLPKYVRWHPTPEGWAMQTAVTTFENKEQRAAGAATTTTTEAPPPPRLELHAQLHFADACYFDYYNSKSFNQDRTVLYELLADENLLATTSADCEQQPPFRTVVSHRALAASPQDQQTALHYGWTCQVDTIQYDQSNWIHADLSRQEFLDLALPTQTTPHEQQQTQRPLWQVAAQNTNNNNKNNNNNPLVIPAAAAEAATALLVGPPIMFVEQQQHHQRRLFSNLFLPGNALAQVLRALLWFTVPCPEVSILLLDWSSLLLMSKTRGFSNPMTAPLLQALASARFDQVRRLVFGQVIVSSSQIHSATTSTTGRAYDLLIQRRNQKALSVLAQQLRQQQQQQRHSSSSIIALLYGCSHCPDLHQQVMAMGYTPLKTEWRTAWTIATNRETTATPWSSLLILVPLYLAIGGLDWISTWSDIVVQEMSNRDDPQSFESIITALFYLTRHVLLYVGLSKVLWDWEARD